MYYLIKVGSITNAQRARRKLREFGEKAYIVRLANPKATDGCGYAVRTERMAPEKATALLEGEGISVLGVEAE